jgi:hypothetical protein
VRLPSGRTGAERPGWRCDGSTSLGGLAGPAQVGQFMADLASQIAELQAQFQHVADIHPWVCLSNPREHGLAFVGEAHGPDLLRGVNEPQNPARRAVVDHVTILTHRSSALLLLSLKGRSRIPSETRREIEAWERDRLGDGWVRWLWYGSIPRCVRRIDNYPQVAATALQYLKGTLEATTHPPSQRSSGRRKQVPLVNSKRDAWVVRRRAKMNPLSWAEIYDEGVRLSTTRGWNVPGSTKSLEEAYRRYLKRQRQSEKA